jgi:hypothetical protein
MLSFHSNEKPAKRLKDVTVPDGRQIVTYSDDPDIATTESSFEEDDIPTNEIEDDPETVTSPPDSEISTSVPYTTPPVETTTDYSTWSPESTEPPHIETTSEIPGNSSQSEEVTTTEPESFFGSLFSSLGYGGKSEKKQSWGGYNGWWGSTHTNHRPYYSDQQLSSPAEETKSFALNSNIWDMDSFTEKHSVKKASPEEDVTSTESTTVTDQPDVTTMPVPVTATPDINIKRTDTKSMMARILGTTTSTRVSHETEICYRGRCIKTKTKDSDIDQMSIE